ncbi:Pleckstrin y domain-containing family G member 1 [Amphibalanus amphitrite]|uniref:Pleckstrin y domain-containing family G member 1 n=1 Tax=Amphibalanus amphitrite TaxID=1232801 RepID=A0A6A4V1T2_AMPAM|nr:Pleckstrin y domain-containing family G member 1 [Amphibalanus amphitrite]
MHGSSPRLDCLLDIWDSLVLRSKACRAEELRTEPAAGPGEVAESDTSRGAELCAGDVSAAPGSAGSRLDSSSRGGSSSQCGDPCTPAVDGVSWYSPSSELGSAHPSKTLASPLSTLSAPTTDSGICETPSEEACSSFELSVTGESSLSAGGDSTGDEAARGLWERPRPAAGRERRAPRWRTAELRQRPLSVVSTASSSSSSGGGSLPRSLVRRRPARGAARDVTDSAGDRLAVGGGGGLARTQSLQLDGCVTQADRVVAEILHTEAAYVSDLREVLEGYLQYWRDNPARGLRDGHKEILFGNYRDIYLCNSAFLLELQRCRADPLRVAKCFVAHQLRFDVYTDYCTHYPSFAFHRNGQVLPAYATGQPPAVDRAR